MGYREKEMGKKGYLPLFETKSPKGRVLYNLYVASTFVAICLIWVYRVSYFPAEGTPRRWIWIGMFVAEIWFSFYWFLNQLVRWNPVYRYPFRDRLSQRYEEDLPGIDLFVCTADPQIERPIMVVNTVLSMMAYDYPPEKQAVYLSDDGGSDLTFYAMLEVSKFSKCWLPFCKKFEVEPRSPEVYFRTALEPRGDPVAAEEWLLVKEMYNEMKNQIETITKLGLVPEEIRKQHKGFREWDFVSSKRDHQTILQIIIDGRDPKFVDSEGQPLPTLVYLSREKRPQYPHNFKAGAMNALIRVSTKISNAPIIMNVDCDMYSNNSNSIRDALCFLMDEEKGQQIAYVQYPQAFENITRNDLYGSSLNVIFQLELRGMDGYGGTGYIGTGCFHKRQSLCGRSYCKEYKVDWLQSNPRKTDETAAVLEEAAKVLANCKYEEGTKWGKEIGLKYGCPAEDMMTGFSIQCRGWKSVYFVPERRAFLGLAPTTLLDSLVQHRRWSDGDFQVFLSTTFLSGLGRMSLLHKFSYCPYLLWAPNCLPTLYYFIMPSLCLLRGIHLFPQASSPWFQAFVYAILANSAYGLAECIWHKGTAKSWWNNQRMKLFKRTTSYLFGFFDRILKILGLANSGFAITAKVVQDGEASYRYEKEVMEFGASSPMFNIIATIALLNLFSFVYGVKMAIMDIQFKTLDLYAMQILLCGVLVTINVPVFQGLFFRRDNGKMPTSVTYKSMFIATSACSIALIQNGYIW